MNGRHGATGFHGGEFQINLYTTFLLCGYNKNEDFCLKGEEKQAGKFDDLIYESNTELILLQAKHKADEEKEISAYQIFKDTGDFSLIKYLNSYVGIRSKYAKNAIYVICSNSNLNTDIIRNKFVEPIVTHDSSSIFFDFNKEGETRLYSFNTNETRDILIQKNQAAEEEINDFLERLMFLNLSDRAIKTIIRKYISNLIHFDRSLTQESTYNYIFKKVKEWLNNKKLPNLTKLQLESYIYEFSSITFTQSLERHSNKITFSNTTLPDDKQVVLISSSRYQPVMLKLCQMLEETIEKCLFINPDTTPNLVQILNVFINLKHFTHLILQLSDNNETSAINDTKEILRERAYKKLIIIHDCPLELEESDFACSIPDGTFYNKIKVEEIPRKYIDQEFYFPRKLFQDDFKLKDKKFTEEGFLTEILQNRHEITVISDIPGMGKSSVLWKLMCVTYEKFKDILPITINLNANTELFEDCFTQNKSLTLEDLLSSSPELSKLEKFDQQILSIAVPIIIMLDGLDEIGNNSIKIIYDFIRNNSNNPYIRKIIITTRPHMADCIKEEKGLNIKMFKLSRLAVGEKVLFVREYLTKKLKRKDIKIDLFAKILCNKIKDTNLETLVEIPLMLKLLTDIFPPDPEALRLITRGICSIGNISKLYRTFIEKKSNIYVEEKCNITRGNKAGVTVNKQFEEIIEYCENIAITSLSDEISELFKDEKLHSLEIPFRVYDVGILTESSGMRQFVHKSFAEYFVARRIYEKIISLKSPKMKYLIENIFLDEKSAFAHSNVNQFLNSILEDKWHELPASFPVFYNLEKMFTITPIVLSNCLYILKFLSEKCALPKEILLKIDNSIIITVIELEYYDIATFLYNTGLYTELKDGQTFLHLASQTENVQFVHHLIRKVGLDVNGEDRNGYTPLHVASVKGCLSMVRKLVAEGANLHAKTKNGETPLKLSREPDVTKFLTEQMSKNTYL